MFQVLWFALAWIAGAAAILGSLMTLGSLLLWVVPVQPRSRQPEAQPAPTTPLWQRLKLLSFSVAIALAGLGILVVLPFPSF